MALADIEKCYRLTFADKSNSIASQIGTTANELRDKAIIEAIRWYSRRMPRIKVNLILAQSSAYYATPAEWLGDRSRIIFIEHPIDQDPPLYLSPKSWRIVKREADDVIYLSSNPNGDLRLGFTTKHADDASTIPEQHEEIIGKMAASVSAISASDFYGHTIVNNVDAVGYRTKEKEWRDLGENLRNQVDRELRRDELALRKALDPRTYFKGWA